MEHFDLHAIQHFNTAYENTYQVITGKKTFEEVVENGEDDGVYFMEDPQINLKEETIDDLIAHFIILEEYEKCQELSDLKKTLK